MSDKRTVTEHSLQHLATWALPRWTSGGKGPGCDPDCRTFWVGEEVIELDGGKALVEWLRVHHVWAGWLLREVGHCEAVPRVAADLSDALRAAGLEPR